MSKLEFISGYYEWHLLLDGNILHTWGDFLDDLECDENGESSEEQCCDMADLLMFGWKEESEDNEDIKFIDDGLFTLATETIANELYRRYGRNNMSDMVNVTTYGRTETLSRKDAIAKYREAAEWCEGSERDRYVTVLFQLMDGKVNCSDEVY